MKCTDLQVCVEGNDASWKLEDTVHADREYTKVHEDTLHMKTHYPFLQDHEDTLHITNYVFFSKFVHSPY